VRPVRFEPRQHPRPGACRNNDVLCLIGSLAFCALGHRIGRFDNRLLRFGHDDLTGLRNCRFAPDHVDFVFLEQKSHTAGQFSGYAARAFDHSRWVKPHIVGCQPVVGGVLHIVIDFSRTQQRLCRDTAPVQANAAEMLTLDDCRFQSQLSRPDGRDVSPGTGPNNHNIISGIRHLQSSGQGLVVRNV